MESPSRQILESSLYVQDLDQAVEEVFGLMMGVQCAAQDVYPAEESETISAVIGLAGAMSGTCVLRSGAQVALRMAEMLTGVATSKVDEMVKDAMGEICNMVAGAWKGKQPTLASGCMLSTPTVVTGTNYRLHTQRPEFRVERCYRFETFSFGLTLICESLQ